MTSGSRPGGKREESQTTLVLPPGFSEPKIHKEILALYLSIPPKGSWNGNHGGLNVYKIRRLFRGLSVPFMETNIEKSNGFWPSQYGVWKYDKRRFLGL